MLDPFNGATPGTRKDRTMLLLLAGASSSREDGPAFR